ncbi:RusA family crossover junction endodeoxyribonuclease [Clostridium massiliamazoniense]|uniref:RusA family crossover junction endodeoxyribonuclease n=1 Tax=Clostridium massiliamazoniense TaxID=1347366 RepID=UPI0006D8619A|nr:RusA family crossover junction endodeoxyribonuclease [Clostridium massiliamazoniense]
MVKSYAKIVVDGSPITKSNFKLHNKQGRAILPSNTGKSHDKYANYEEEISYKAKVQNPDILLEESLIAILKVFYKSEKRHPDTSNITKSIFDGIEKSGIIVNDKQIRKIIIEEFYDKENPRFELELFGESSYDISYNVKKLEKPREKILYNSTKLVNNNNIKSKKIIENNNSDKITCDLCNKTVIPGEFVTANKGKTNICRQCLSKTF